MNSATGLHAPCQAATIKVVPHPPFFLRRFRRCHSRKIMPAHQAKSRTCFVFAQLKRMQIARFLCIGWGKYIRSGTCLPYGTCAETGLRIEEQTPPVGLGASLSASLT